MLHIITPPPPPPPPPPPLGGGGVRQMTPPLGGGGGVRQMTPPPFLTPDSRTIWTPIFFLNVEFWPLYFLWIGRVLNRIFHSVVEVWAWHIPEPMYSFYGLVPRAPPPPPTHTQSFDPYISLRCRGMSMAHTWAYVFILWSSTPCPPPHPPPPPRIIKLISIIIHLYAPYMNDAPVCKYIDLYTCSHTHTTSSSGHSMVHAACGIACTMI